MKKRFLKLFSWIMAFASVCSLVACGDTEAKSRLYTDVLINDFEVSQEYDACLMGNYLGKITINSNADYVTNGAHSAKVDVGNSKVFMGNPYIYQSLVLKKGDFTSFADVKMVSVDVYNASEMEKSVYLSLNFTSNQTAKVKYTLAPQSWTTVYHVNHREYMQSTKCEGVYIYFENATDGVNTYYLDNLHLYRTELGYTKLQLKLGKDEVYSFDRYEQTGLLTTVTDGGSVDVEMTTEHTATGEGGALKIMAGHGSAVYPLSYNYPGVTLSPRVLSLFPFEEYTDEDYLCFDIYSDNEMKINDLFLVLTNDFDVRYFDYMFGELVLPKTWTTIRVSVAQINALVPEEEGFSTTSTIQLLWGEFVGQDRVFYLDNFRMERGG